MKLKLKPFEDKVSLILPMHERSHGYFEIASQLNLEGLDILIKQKIAIFFFSLKSNNKNVVTNNTFIHILFE